MAAVMTFWNLPNRLVEFNNLESSLPYLLL